MNELKVKRGKEERITSAISLLLFFLSTIKLFTQPWHVNLWREEMKLWRCTCVYEHVCRSGELAVNFPFFLNAYQKRLFFWHCGANLKGKSFKDSVMEISYAINQFMSRNAVHWYCVSAFVSNFWRYACVLAFVLLFCGVIRLRILYC